MNMGNKCRDCGAFKDDPDQTYCACSFCPDCEKLLSKCKCEKETENE